MRCFEIIWIFSLEPLTISVMRIVELSGETFPGTLFEAVRIVKRGGVICYPTDTVYGIGGNALDAKVARRVYRIKRRPKDKAMILLVKDMAMARKYAYIDLWTEGVLADLWPGPVTVVLHRKDTLPDIVAGGKDTIAMRLPNFRFVNELMKQVDFPLIATSANISGDTVKPVEVRPFVETLRETKAKPDLVIDAGRLAASEPSTVLDLTDRGNPVIMRRGLLSKSELDQMLAKHL